MKEVKSWWMPDWDTHFEDHLKKENTKYTYQQMQRDYALSYCEKHDIALDIGANIGFWSKDLCSMFKNVIAFEPHPENVECYKQNLDDYKNYVLCPFALSNEINSQGQLFTSKSNSGNAGLNKDGVIGGETEITSEIQDRIITCDVDTLDNFIKSFTNRSVDFIKIDVQGYELEVLEGGVELLKNYSPVLCLELPLRNQKEKEYGQKVTSLLGQLGYTRRGNCKKETIFTK